MDEDKRLYYVALTRAQFKLYVPFCPATSNHAWIGPVCRFVSASISQAFPETSDHPAAGWINAADPEAVAYRGEIPAGPAAVFETLFDQNQPLLPGSRNFQSRKIMLESFSSLQEKHTPEADLSGPDPGFRLVRDKEWEDDEGFAPVDADSVRAVREDDEIPGGPDIGSMFHDILEHIDFEAVVAGPVDILADRETADIIGRTMDAHRIDRRWSSQVARLVRNTLTTPVTAGEDPFVLGRIPAADRIHEVAFYYPFAGAGSRSPKIPDVEVVSGPRGFIRGFVDLVFRYGGKYFIADWKSNRLEGGYGPAALEACMREAGYHLQYKLYTIALLRWLRHVNGDGAEPLDRFGGIFYFFLRGMGTGSGKGVYFVPPARAGDLEQLELEIEELTFRAGVD
jgi:exodeoxyribonuclease V beta subunit